MALFVPDAPAGRIGSKPGGMLMNALSAAIKLLSRPERYCTARTFRCGSGFGQLTWSPLIRLALSGTQLQRQMGCSYKTAWYLLHRLRRGMVNESRTPLRGRVEADEVIIGGPVKGKTGRGVTKDEKNTLVFGAVEVIVYTDKHGACMEKAGRLRLAVTQRADAISIRRFLTAHVQAGSEIYTDGWKGYSKTALADYSHELHEPETHALHIHRAFGNLKTWLNGTHHGVDPKYLQNYLDEFVFRFNRRKTPMAAFQTLLGLAAQKVPVGYEKMTLRESTG